MENNYKKLLCAISVIAVIVIIIQLDEAFSSNFGGQDTKTIGIEEEEGETNLGNKINTNSQTKTNSSNSNNNKFIIGSNLTVLEGELISLTPSIANAIAMPSNSLIYSWNQVEGPKINLPDEDKKNKVLNFMAPNRPTDTKYAFELKVVQKTPSGNIDLGKDIINILVIDTNKAAKGANTNIPPTSSQSLPPESSSPSSSSPSSPLPNIPTKNNEGDIVVQGGGQFNPNFRDGLQK